MPLIILLALLSVAGLIGFIGSLVSGECSFSEKDGRRRLIGTLLAALVCGTAAVLLWWIRSHL